MEGDGLGMIAIVKGEDEGWTVTVLPGKLLGGGGKKNNLNHIKGKNHIRNRRHGQINKSCDVKTTDGNFLPGRGVQSYCARSPPHPLLYKKSKSFEMTREMSYFVQSLRKYPVTGSETRSSELIREVLALPQLSDHQNKERSIKRPVYRAASQHSYIQEKNWSEDTKEVGRETKNRYRTRHASALQDRHRRPVKNTYDYLGNKDVPQPMEVRHVAEIRNICNRFRNIITSKPTSCPKLQNHINIRKRFYRGCDTGKKVNPCACKSIQVSLPIAHSSILCHPPLEDTKRCWNRSHYCHLPSPRNSEVSMDSIHQMQHRMSLLNNSDYIKINDYKRRIKYWTKSLACFCKHNSYDKVKEIQLVTQLAERLHVLSKEDDFLYKAKTEIDKFIQKLVMLLPNWNDEYNLDHLSDDLLKSILYKENDYEQEVNKLLADLPLNDSNIEDTKKTVNDFLRQINKSFDSITDEDLELKILNLFDKLPLKYDGKLETLNKLVDMLIKKLHVIMKTKNDTTGDTIKEKYVEHKNGSNLYLSLVKSWLKDIPELDVQDNNEILNKLSDLLHEIIRDQKDTSVHSKIKKEISKWLQQMLAASNIFMDKGMQENVVNKLILKLIKLPLQSGEENSKNRNHYFNDIYAWFKNIPYYKLNTKIDIEQLINDLSNKFNYLEENDNGTFKIQNEIDNWLHNLHNVHGVHISNEDRIELKRKMSLRMRNRKRIIELQIQLNELIQNYIKEFLEKKNLELKTKDFQNIKFNIIPYVIDILNNNSLNNKQFREQIKKSFILYEIDLPIYERDILIEMIINTIKIEIPDFDVHSEVQLELISIPDTIESSTREPLNKGKEKSKLDDYLLNNDLNGDASLRKQDSHTNGKKGTHYNRQMSAAPTSGLLNKSDTTLLNNSEIENNGHDISKDLSSNTITQHKSKQKKLKETEVTSKTHDILTSTPQHNTNERFSDADTMSYILNDNGPIDIYVETDVRLLNHIINDWINTIEINFNEKDKQKIITHLVNGLIDRQKYLELSKKSFSDLEEIEYLKFLVFKVFSNLLEHTKLEYILFNIHKLHEMTKSIKRTRSDDGKHNKKDTNGDIFKWVQDISSDEIKTCDIQQLIEAIKNFQADGSNHDLETSIEKNIWDWLQRTPYDLNQSQVKKLKNVLSVYLKDQIQKTNNASDEFRELYDIKMILDSWINNLPFELQESFKNMNKFLEEFINGVVRYVSQKNSNTIKRQMLNDIEQLLQIIPLNASREINRIMNEKMSDLITIIKNEIHLNSKLKNNGNKIISKGFLFNILESWCNNLPIHVEEINIPKETQNGVRYTLAEILLEKIMELHKYNNLFDSSDLNIRVLEHEIQNILNNIAMSNGNKGDITHLISILIDGLKLHKQTIRKELDSMIYKQDLKNYLSKNIPHLQYEHIEEQTPIEIVIDNLADAFVNLHFHKDDNEMISKYKQKINDEIEQFCKDYLQRYPASPLNHGQIHSKLYKVLESVPKPLPSNLNISKDTLKREIGYWLDEMVIDPNFNLTKKEKMVSILEKQLQDLLKDKTFNIHNGNDQVKDVIFRWLQDIPLKHNKVPKLELVNRLINRMKCKFKRDSSLSTPTGSMYKYYNKTNKRKSKRIISQNENVDKNTNNKIITDALPADILTVEHKSLLENVRRRYSNLSDPFIIPFQPKSTDLETQTSRRNKTFQDKSIQKSDSALLDKPELKQGNLPRVVVREYLWDSNGSGQSSRTNVPRNSSNKSGTQKSLDKISISSYGSTNERSLQRRKTSEETKSSARRVSLRKNKTKKIRQPQDKPYAHSKSQSHARKTISGEGIQINRNSLKSDRQKKLPELNLESRQLTQTPSNEFSMSSIVSSNEIQTYISEGSKTSDQTRTLTEQRANKKTELHEKSYKHSKTKSRDYGYDEPIKDQEAKPDVQTELPELLLANRQYKLPNKFILIPENLEQSRADTDCYCNERILTKCRIQPCRKAQIPCIRPPKFHSCPCYHNPCLSPTRLCLKRDF